jgi:glycosyltransferase involved in cell wall biosynthesis
MMPVPSFTLRAHARKSAIRKRIQQLMPALRPPLFHLNTSPTLGGAEVYAHFLASVLKSAGWENEIVVAEGAAYWSDLDGREEHSARYRIAGDFSSLSDGSIVFVHAPLPAEIVKRLRAKHLVVGMAHQALYSDAVPSYYREADVLLSVSDYVISTLSKAGLTRVHAQPLWGVAALRSTAGHAPIVRGPMCDWDKRKLRDRILGWVEPLGDAIKGKPRFEKRPGLTLGIVSRIAPLKQFPKLFEAIVPALLEQPDVNLDIFGSAIGYAPLRDLRVAVRPLGDRVRWWGYQSDVAAVYGQLDYLLTGLPEREALGLNVIEAQQCGLPVLAPKAPPFIETMVDEASGYLYTDPRQDGASDFRRVLKLARANRPDPRLATTHLERFSREAFTQRAAGVVDDLVANRTTWKRND